MKMFRVLYAVLSIVLVLVMCVGCSSEKTDTTMTDEVVSETQIENEVVSDSQVEEEEIEEIEENIAETVSEADILANVHLPADGVKIMPLGDSLTSGYNSKDFGGYRTYLCNKLEAIGYSEYVDFVGKWNTGKCYDTDHVGTNGHTIDNVQETLDNENLMATYNPDIVLLMIGTNDVNWDRKDLENIGTRYELLVDTVLKGLPEGGLLYVCTIPYQVCNVATIDEDVDSFNKSVKAIAYKKAAEGHNVILVDVNALITRSDLHSDGLHLSDAGYEKLGNMWYDVLAKAIGY